MLGLGILLCLNVFVSPDTSVSDIYYMHDICMSTILYSTLGPPHMVSTSGLGIHWTVGVHGGSLGCVCIHSCDTSTPITVMVNVEAIVNEYVLVSVEGTTQ